MSEEIYQFEVESIDDEKFGENAGELIEELCEINGYIAREFSLYYFVGSTCSTLGSFYLKEEKLILECINDYISKYCFNIYQNGNFIRMIEKH